MRQEHEPVAEEAGWLSLFQPRDRTRVRAWLNGVLEARIDDILEVRGASAGQWLEIRAAPRDDPDAGLVVIALDISAQKWREDLLTFGAIHDPMTGVHNRIALLERMELALAQKQGGLADLETEEQRSRREQAIAQLGNYISMLRDTTTTS